MSSEPGHRPLLPSSVARFAAFAALALLGVNEWRRMVDGTTAQRGAIWVLAACAGALAVIATARLGRRLEPLGLLMAGAAALAAAVLASGIDPELFVHSSRWAELGDGLGRGIEALSGVRLPYRGADPWPGLTLDLMGALLCAVAALVAFWPRGNGRGYPGFALMVLLVLAGAPVVSLGGTRPIWLGLSLAALTVAFLWLERIPLRPGLGVAALSCVALAAALPLGSAADGEEPWFDYRTFAEGLGPEDPVRYRWEHGYGPIDWPRERREILRIEAEQPFYWKVQNLDQFDGTVWTGAGAGDAAGGSPEGDLAPEWRYRPGWTVNFKVTVRRLRSRTLVGAGTTLEVTDATRPVRRGPTPGSWVSDAELRRGDSYRVSAHVPRPNAVELADAASGGGIRQLDKLALSVPFTRIAERDRTVPRAPGGTPVRGAVIAFSPFAEDTPPVADYPTLGVRGSGIEALRRSPYWRTWQLSRRLKRAAKSPFDYILRVNAYLRADRFGYTERPPAISGDAAPLDAFLFDTRSGYCQHFSGAMALLLRMGGIPARVVGGFSPGGFKKRRGEWIVRDTDAHSWVEAYYDQFGWVTYDPTPPGTPARSQIAAIDEPSGGDRAQSADSGVEAGNGGGGDDGGRRGSGLRGDLANDPLEEATGDEEASAAGGAGGIPWPGVLAVAAALVVAVLLRRRLLLRGAGHPSPLERAIAEVEEAFRRAGRPAPPGATLATLEARLAGGDGAEYLRALRRVRYSNSPGEPPTRAQRAALRRDLGRGTGWLGRLRALWALPPWRG